MHNYLKAQKNIKFLKHVNYLSNFETGIKKILMICQNVGFVFLGRLCIDESWIALQDLVSNKNVPIKDWWNWRNLKKSWEKLRSGVNTRIYQIIVRYHSYCEILHIATHFYNFLSSFRISAVACPITPTPTHSISSSSVPSSYILGMPGFSCSVKSFRSQKSKHGGWLEG